jgi:hypothetical protein
MDISYRRFTLKIDMDISYRRFTLEVHISLVHCIYAMCMKIPPFNSVKQFLWMVLVKCQHELIIAIYDL